ncbi:MAG: hypothetical protein K6U87_01070 [Firmicutes bacterium]|nr:hypothetical protein [Bacillota bacterium]
MNRRTFPDLFFHALAEFACRQTLLGDPLFGPEAAAAPGVRGRLAAGTADFLLEAEGLLGQTSAGERL